MKKIYCILICFSAFCSTQAQSSNTYTKGFKISAGLTMAIPSNNLPLWAIGAGVDLLTQYGITEKLALTGDAGFANLFSAKGIKSYRIIPVRIGARFFATDRLYLAAKTGVGFLKVKGIEGATALAYSVGGGYMLNKKFDLGLAYDGYSKNGTIGLVAVRVGYFFSNE